MKTSNTTTGKRMSSFWLNDIALGSSDFSPDFICSPTCFAASFIASVPISKQEMSQDKLAFVYRAKGMIKELSVINFEIAQMTVASDENEAIPDWFMVEVIRDLPRLVEKK